MTLDCASFLESQQAIPMVTRAIPASLATMMAVGSIRVVPSKEEATKEGTINKAKPVAPSIKAVMVNNVFNFIMIFI